MLALRLFKVAMMALALAGLAFLYVFSVASAEGAPRPRPGPFRSARPPAPTCVTGQSSTGSSFCRLRGR